MTESDKRDVEAVCDAAIALHSRIERSPGWLHPVVITADCVPSLVQQCRRLVEAVTEEERATASAVADFQNLRSAVYDAGFGVMRAGGKFSIHDVSEKARTDDEKTTAIIMENIDLLKQNERLREGNKHLREVLTQFRSAWETATWGYAGLSDVSCNNLEAASDLAADVLGERR